jgi:RNA recognition motif-containing protein
MNTKLYVGNLSFDATENDLEDLFAQHGPVTAVNLIQDRATGKPRGFGFVTMATREGAEDAINSLNGKEWKGHALTVNEARPREERPAGNSRGPARARRY